MKEYKLSIRIAGNTSRPTLLAIQAKGYKITLEYTINHEGNEDRDFDAEKDGMRFSATSPEELLGLIAMWEVRGDDWKYDHKVEPDLEGELIESAITYDLEGNIVEL